MFKKTLFFILAVFGLSSMADMHSDSGMDHMSDMAGVTEENGGPHGAIEVKYKYNVDGDPDVKDTDVKSYRARIGWKGEVNDVVKWGVGATTNVQQEFTGPGVQDVFVDTAYVAYSPVEGFVVKAGKWAWEPSFHKSGILYDDDLYQEGFFAKYMYGDKEESYTYVKAAVNWLDGDYRGACTEETRTEQTEGSGSDEPKKATNCLFGDKVVWAKVGGSYAVSDGIKGSVYAGGVYGGLATEGNKDTVLVKAGVGLSVSSTPVPLGFYAVYLNNKDFKDHSYSFGAFVGGADKASSKEKGDFGVGVSYHKVEDTAYNTTFLDDDYGQITEGVTARAQYNLWENSNLVAKYAHGLGTAKNNSVVTGELTFNF